MNAKPALIIACLLVSLDSAACISNTDCQRGSRCDKQEGSLEGVCLGGEFPGNDYDRTPMRNVLDSGGGLGDTCRFDGECSRSYTCHKENSSLGACMPRE